MKNHELTLKILGCILAGLSAACLILANLERITALLACLQEHCPLRCCCAEDFAEDEFEELDL